MAVNKVEKYSMEVAAEAHVRPEGEVKTKYKARLSARVFSIVMLGAMTIILVDGLKNYSIDPMWTLICVLIGVPTYFYGLFELFHMK